MADDLPPPIGGAPQFQAVSPPPGSPDYARKNGTAAAASEAADLPADAPPLVAVLDFVKPRCTPIPLDHPFRLDGRLIESITVKRLEMEAVNALVAKDRYRDLYEIYAEMTGLPAAVLRGLDGDDGDRVTGAAWDFLPRILRTVFESE